MADCNCKEEGCPICDPPYPSPTQEEIAALRAQLEQAKAERDALKVAWIEKAGHWPGCAGTRKCTHCGKPPWSYRHLVDAVGFDHDFQPGPCTCGWSELVGE